MASAMVAQALKTRIFGFELLPAPFVVSHLQLTLLLRQLGIRLGDDERIGVFLTNALRGWEEAIDTNIPLWDETFEKEREEASRVKREEPIIVVLGNPPYARYTSAAISEERELIAYYKGQIDADGNRHQPSLLYTQWGIGKQTLDDLYIRFFRIAERRIRANGMGVISLISNAGWLIGASNPIMRESLLEGFDKLWIDDLHGGAYSGGPAPEGEANGSVFTYGASPGISIAVAITTAVRSANARAGLASVYHRDIWGTGAEKRTRLLQDTIEYQEMAPRKELRWILRPVELGSTPEYLSWRPLHGDVFRERYSGVHTGRDPVVVNPDRQPLEELAELYYNAALLHDEVAAVEPLLMRSGNEFADPRGVRQALLERHDYEILRYAFRPFDYQWLWWERYTKLIQRKAEDLHDIVSDNNPLLITDARQYVNRGQGWDALYVTRRLPASKITQAGCKVFPLNIRTELFGQTLSEPNISLPILTKLLSANGNDPNDADQRSDLAEDVFFHAVAIMASPAYRASYGTQLAASGARIPIPVDRELLVASAALGRRVADLFDMDARTAGIQYGDTDGRLDGIAVTQRTNSRPITGEEFRVEFGQGRDEGGRWVERPFTDDEHYPAEFGGSTYDVLLNSNAHFTNVPKEIGDFSVGQYPVLRKWLSYRRVSNISRALTLTELLTFRDIARRVAAILLLAPDLDSNLMLIKSSALLERNGGPGTVQP
jgi:predicted helicase